MSQRTEKSYLDAFKKILEICSCKFCNIIIDFEMALINGIKIFEGANSFACLFHFGQVNWRAIQRFGICGSYINEISVRKMIKRFLNLAFIPVEHVKKEFDILVAIAKRSNIKNIENYIEYFEIKIYWN
jgi:hypothetical protein